MEDSIVQLIVAISGLLSAAGGILGFFAAKFHLDRRVGDIASSLQETDNWVAEHEVQLKTGVKVAEELSPEAQALLDANRAKVDALTAEIQQKAQALEELKKALPAAV